MNKKLAKVKYLPNNFNLTNFKKNIIKNF